MEPADQRRDDDAPARAALVSGSGRNGARRPAAGRRATGLGGPEVKVCRNGARRPAAGRLDLIDAQPWYACRPQWSPPTSGGTTRRRNRHHDAQRNAAMEPADQRRDDRPHRVLEPGQPSAAMEPADQRRDDLLDGAVATVRAGTGRNGARRPAAGRLVPVMPAVASAMQPQWSPPTSGGTTSMDTRPARAHTAEPQWSPPTSGGTTVRRPRPGQHRDAAAMEPADQRRDDAHQVSRTTTGRARPQWSPPTSGGTTCAAVAVAAVQAFAAMEPADQRRDDRSTCRCCDLLARGRNGARRPAAGRPSTDQ